VDRVIGAIYSGSRTIRKPFLNSILAEFLPGSQVFYARHYWPSFIINNPSKVFINWLTRFYASMGHGWTRNLAVSNLADKLLSCAAVGAAKTKICGAPCSLKNKRIRASESCGRVSGEKKSPVTDMDKKLYNVNVVAKTVLPTPSEIRAEIPIGSEIEQSVLQCRETVCNILDQRDPRIFAVVGPCSIHDVDAALKYAERLQRLAEEVSDSIYLVMRVYFEKPRTTVGWKGLINDPDMDDSFHVEKGVRIARELLLELARRGLPTATEALDPVMPQYLGELISWTAIGARTTESQTHREMASGLSTPVGFKNGTDGSLKVAINALESARQPHHFLGINQEGRTAVFQTRGNAYGHIVLRGGGGRPNYDADSIAATEAALRDAGLPESIVVDCSHANSNKDPSAQPMVARDCIQQVVDGNRSIIGLMLESNINAGNQKIPANLGDLQYGVSVTDGCIDWETTETLIRESAEALRPIVAKNR
jgi:3-deoxy-7-phosphoheptulonate synthase